jgi:membrane associated rhomboid family serine protease/Zn-finger nucleic acid-binding protein
MPILIHNQSKRMCPVCKVGLLEKKIGDLIIDRCPSCEGCWYDWQEVESLLQTKRNILHYVPPELQRIYSGPLPCPVCSLPLKRLLSNSIFSFDIDYCSEQHGIWLDQDELDKIHAVVEKTRYRFHPRGEKNKEESMLVKKVESQMKQSLDQTHKLNGLLKRSSSGDPRISFEEMSAPQRLISLLGMPVESGDIYEKGAWLNGMFLFINVAVYILAASSGHFVSLSQTWGFTPSLFAASPFVYYHTLVTSLFFHGGLFHLLSNMYFLFVTGDDIEKRLGHFFYLLFYIMAGITTSAWSLSFPPLSIVPHLGAGGAISAVIGAYTVLCRDKKFYIWTRSKMLFNFSSRFIAVPAVLYFLFWFLVQVLSVKLGTPGINYLAHIVGFLFGLMIGGLVHLRQRYNPDTAEWEWK